MKNIFSINRSAIRDLCGLITTNAEETQKTRNLLLLYGNRRSQYSFLRLTLLLLLLVTILPPITMAQQSDTTASQLNRYLSQAAENNPSLKAEYRGYLSALENVPQVTSLPDPELSFGYFISPIETRVGPQQARFGLTQMFPWFGTLGAKGDAAAAMARARFEGFQEVRNKLFYDVQKQWYRLYHIDQSLRIMQENISILETFESLAIRRYEAGQVGQVDVLRVQIEKEDLKTRLEAMKDNLSVSKQEFRELLNLKSKENVIVADSLETQELELTVPELKERIMKQNAQISKLDYEAASSQSLLEAARKDGLPKFGLGIDYVVTGERGMALTDNGKDAVMARVGIQIPLYRKKYRAKEKQAQINLHAVQDRQVAVQNRLFTQLDQAIRDYKDAQRRVSLLRDVQVQRTRQAINILTEQYATSATDFEELLRLQRKLLDYELARETALVDQYTAVAYIEYLYGKYNINPEEIKPAESRKF